MLLALSLIHNPSFFMRRLLALAGLLLAPSFAQSQAINEPIPQITVVGHGETKVSPDRANIQISVQTRAAAAGAAGAANATRQRAVLDALRKLGLTDDQLSTANYNVNPEYKYEPNRNPTIIGYSATNTIVAEVRDLTKVGAVIDAALGAGANLISSLNFYASNIQQARQSAITAAVQVARTEAEVGARAAQGTLGGLLELTIGAYYAPPPRPMMMMAKSDVAQASETPVQPGQETVTVAVTTRWGFIPGR
jgi:uncharacterized protein YggE